MKTQQNQQKPITAEEILRLVREMVIKRKKEKPKRGSTFQ